MCRESYWEIMKENKTDKITSHELNEYKRAEITKYLFLATLDKTTCSLCGNLDGEVFDVDKAVIGINFPPLHEGCRCSTCAYLEDYMPKKRSARNKVSGRSEIIPYIKYKDWIIK